MMSNLPPVDIPVGGQASSNNPPGWSGLTIKEILEKVDLFNVTLDEAGGDVKKEKVLVGGGQVATTNGTKPQDAKVYASASDPSSAYLGPKLWDKPISLSALDDAADFSIMNIDDFLNENNLSLDAAAGGEGEEEDGAANMTVADDPMMPSAKDSSPEPEAQDDQQAKLELIEEMIEIQQRHHQQQQQQQQQQPKRKKSEEQPAKPVVVQNKTANILPKNSDTGFLYAESKRARLAREKEEKERQMLEQQQQEEEEGRGETQADIEFAPEDLALATIPGADFDPRRRAFSTDELKPQPIIRKRRKHYVPSESKDERYWEKRLKNNVAARRSREARRLKENQIALRAAFLEKENDALKLKVDEITRANAKLQREKEQLRERLRRYE